MSLARRIELIRSVPLFQLLDDTALRALAGVAAEVAAPAGVRLQAAGEPADGGYLVESGRVHLTGRAFGPEGLTSGPGTLVGARALVIPVRNGFDVDTLTPVRLLVFTRAAFLALLAEYPDAARPLRRQFARVLGHMSGALTDLGQTLLSPGSGSDTDGR